MGRVVNAIPRLKLGWFFSSLGYNIYYEKRLLDDFHLVNGNQFACGYTFFCNNCNMIASYIREDLIMNWWWLVVHVKCSNCGAVYKISGLRPFYETLFEEWDISKSPEWIHHDLEVSCNAVHNMREMRCIVETRNSKECCGREKP